MEQWLCADAECELGWQNPAEYLTKSGKYHGKCRSCLNLYQREYWSGKTPMSAVVQWQRTRAALDELARCWPDPFILVEDKGRYDYDAGEWYATPFPHYVIPQPWVEKSHASTDSSLDSIPSLREWSGLSDSE